jgi:hypothetical protein
MQHGITPFTKTNLISFLLILSYFNHPNCKENHSVICKPLFNH